MSMGGFAARKALGLDREDPGVFWMAVDDFLAYFVELTVCRVLRDRVDARVGGWLGSAFNGGECVAVEAYARTRLDVALYQEPHAVRQGEAGAATALDLGCAVVKCASRSDRAVAGDAPSTNTHGSRSFDRMSAPEPMQVAQITWAPFTWRIRSWYASCGGGWLRR